MVYAVGAQIVRHLPRDFAEDVQRHAGIGEAAIIWPDRQGHAIVINLIE